MYQYVYISHLPLHSVTVANEGLWRFSTKNVIILLVTGILDGGYHQVIHPKGGADLGFWTMGNMFSFFFAEKKQNTYYSLPSLKLAVRPWK